VRIPVRAMKGRRVGALFLPLPSRGKEKKRGEKGEVASKIRFEFQTGGKRKRKGLDTEATVGEKRGEGERYAPALFRLEGEGRGKGKKRTYNGPHKKKGGAQLGSALVQGEGKKKGKKESALPGLHRKGKERGGRGVLLITEREGERKKEGLPEKGRGGEKKGGKFIRINYSFGRGEKKGGKQSRLRGEGEKKGSSMWDGRADGERGGKKGGEGRKGNICSKTTRGGEKEGRGGAGHFPSSPSQKGEEKKKKKGGSLSPGFQREKEKREEQVGPRPSCTSVDGRRRGKGGGRGEAFKGTAEALKGGGKRGKAPSPFCFPPLHN